jgi:hypothetical protein
MEKNTIKRMLMKRKELDAIQDIDKKTQEIVAMLDIDIEDFKKAYNESGDFVLAQLQALEKKVLSKAIANTITLNGNVIPDELYDRITEAANTATLFKQNRESLAKLITSLQEGDIIALSPLQIAQLLINVSEEDKPLFSEEDKEIINDLAKTQQVYKAEEAKAILSFLEMKRLSTRENTDLYNRVINSLEHNCEYEPLFIEEGQLIRVSEEKKKEIKTPIKKIELNNDNNKRTRKI